MIFVEDDLKEYFPFIEFAYKSMRDHFKFDFDLIYSSGVKVLKESENPIRLHIIPSKHLFGESFLKISSLPKDVNFFKADEESIPTLFSSVKPFIVFKKSKLVTNIDLVETYFFFLSLYEEVVIKARDKFGRFPEKLSVLRTLEIHDIPVLDVLRKVILSILDKEIPGDTKPYITHDIDRLRTRYSLRHIALRAVKGNLKPALEYFKDTFGEKCPEKSLLEILRIDNSANISPILFFMVRKGNILVPNSDYKMKLLMKISKHLNGFSFDIGLHPSLNVKSTEDLKREKEILERIFSRKVKFVRMHYLRYDPMYTFDMMEKAGFEVDSSVGYPSGFGYRMGTSHPLKLFNWNEKREGILEIPLVFMDNSEDIASMKKSLEKVFENLKRYGGSPAINLHNDSPCRIGYDLFRKIEKEE